MSNLLTFDYQGHSIDFDWQFGEYINLTQMATATGKRSHDWVRLDSTQSLLNAYVKRYGNSRNAPIKVVQGGSIQGTWADRLIAIPFAQWCNPDFALWVSEKIEELIRMGETKLQVKPTKQSSIGLPENFYELDFYHQVLAINRLASAYQKTSRFMPDAELEGQYKAVLKDMFSSIGYDVSAISTEYLDISKALDRVSKSVKALPAHLKRNITDEQGILRGIALEHPDRIIYYSDLRKIAPFSNKFAYPSKKLEAFILDCIAKGLIESQNGIGNLTILKWLAG